jgi:hypothetical protein
VPAKSEKAPDWAKKIKGAGAEVVAEVPEEWRTSVI